MAIFNSYVSLPEGIMFFFDGNRMETWSKPWEFTRQVVGDEWDHVGYEPRFKQ